MTQSWPTFLVIGAARAGTTALYTYLRQHPGVFMSPRKETNFFAFEGERLDYAGPGADYVNNSVHDAAAYQQLFADAPPGAARGEASPLYLWSREAPARIHRHVPDVRLIAILRDPVEQVYSHFLYAKRQTLEPLDDFEQAMAAEEERARLRWMPMFQYSSFPRYAEQLRRYYALFPAERIRVFTYEEFSDELPRVMADIFRFIGVDPGFVPDLGYRPNAGGVPKSGLLQRLVMQPNALNRVVGRLLPEELKRRIRDAISDKNLDRPDIPPRARAALLERLHGDIEDLQRLLGRDLSRWLR